MSILTHLAERLRQKNLRSQLTRSKTLTPILDSISEAAKLEGISGDEIIAQYLSGKNEHPVITAALGRPMLPPRPAIKPAPKPAAKTPPTRRRWMQPIPTTAAARPASQPPPTGTISRETFSKLTPSDRMAFVKSGGKLS